MSDDDIDWDSGEPIPMNQFRFTEQGGKQALAIISEFCHGFSIEEIANNNPDFDGNVDMIKAMMMMVCQQAGLVDLEI